MLAVVPGAPTALSRAAMVAIVRRLGAGWDDVITAGGEAATTTQLILGRRLHDRHNVAMDVWSGADGRHGRHGQAKIHTAFIRMLQEGSQEGARRALCSPGLLPNCTCIALQQPPGSPGYR